MANGYFKPEDRIRKKQAARDKDQRDLAERRVSAKELQERNSLVHGLDIQNADMEFGKAFR